MTDDEVIAGQPPTGSSLRNGRLTRGVGMAGVPEGAGTFGRRVQRRFAVRLETA